MDTSPRISPLRQRMIAGMRMRKMAVVLSRDEAARLLAAAHKLKHQTALSVAYAAGLRVSEVVGLKVIGTSY